MWLDFFVWCGTGDRAELGREMERACLAEVACSDFWLLGLCAWDRRFAQCSCCLLLQFGKLELGEDAWFMPNNE